MNEDPSNKPPRLPLVAHWMRLIVLICIGIAIAWFSTQQDVAYDVSARRTHTLSDASTAVLKSLTQPIKFTAYLPSAHPSRDRIDRLIARYQRASPNIKLKFIDPADAPQEVRAAEIRDGEIVIETDGRSERTTVYSEQAITESLARLARNADRWVVFVSGHGERHPARSANHDLSDWASVLEKRGFNVQHINLSEFGNVPDNTTILVIASPQLPFQASEVAAVERYIQAGGNVLWLTEPDAPKEMSALAKLIGVDIVPGTVVDPVTLAHGVDNPAFLLLSRYADHAATKNFNYTTVFFYASAIIDRASAEWTASKLIYSGDKAWSETAELDGNVTYEEQLDFGGPLPLAVALQRDTGEKKQRVIVVGDGDFIANAYLANSGNQDLGVRFVEWLAADDSLINVPTRAAADNYLDLANWQKAIIGFGFLFVLPGAFALNGLLIWWRRRRA